MKSGREVVLSSLEKRWFQGDFTVAFQYLHGAYKKDAERTKSELKKGDLHWI